MFACEHVHIAIYTQVLSCEMRVFCKCNGLLFWLVWKTEMYKYKSKHDYPKSVYL